MPNNAVKNIAAGIAKIERAKTHIQTPLSKLQGLPADVAGLSSLAEKTHRTAKALQAITAGINADIATYTAKVTAEWTERAVNVGENGFRHRLMSDGEVAKKVREDVSRHRRKILTVAAAERESLMASLRQASQTADAVRGAHSDPLSALQRMTIASPLRVTLAQNLSSAGPRTLELAIQDAIMRQDAPLLSAALDRWEAMPSDSRKMIRVNRTDAALSIQAVQQQHQAANQYLAMIDIAAEESEISLSHAEGRDVPASARINLGMKRDALAGMIGDESDSGNENPNKGKSLDEILDERFPALKGSGAGVS